MKAKQIIALLLVFVLCVPLMAYAASGDTTVYITNTGTKYHRSSCGSLWNSSNAVTLQQALNWGYGACQRCNPPTYIVVPTPSKQTSAIDELRGKLQADQLKSEPVKSEIDDYAVFAGTLRLIVYRNFEQAITYHRAGCPRIGESPIRENFDDLKYDRSPCDVCKPPELWTNVGFMDVMPYIPTSNYLIASGIVAFVVLACAVTVIRKKRK